MPKYPELDGRPIPPRRLLPGQWTQVMIADASTPELSVVLETDQILLEAPNWTLDGAALILNGDYRLWRLDLSSGMLTEIELLGIPGVNNDHVLDPDGENIFVSATDVQIYRVPLAGGRGHCVSAPNDRSDLMHFLHGVDPTGQELSVVGVQYDPQTIFGSADIYTMSARGGEYRKLTDGPGASDGCEFSPDGDLIYFNTENFDGHAQIARMRRDGSELQQLTFDDRVNWFPHISPDGTKATYVSFDPGTAGHPENVWVQIRLVDTSDWTRSTTVATVFGGQGAMNVSSWSPDSASFALVAYPLDESIPNPDGSA